MPPKREPEFTLGLTHDQKQLAIDYIHYAAQDPTRYQGGFEVERHGCGDAVVYILDTEEDQRVSEAVFNPDDLRDWTREVGQFWYDHGRLGEEQQNALHYLQLTAAYADGEITKEEIEQAQDDFETSHGFVRTGMKSVQFRKGPEHD